MPRRFLLPLACVALAAAGCGASAEEPRPPPSGALGPVTAAAAGEAVLGLCELEDETDVAGAKAAFFDRSHDELHVIAAATETVDRGTAGELLLAKQRVEAHLEEGALPAGFVADVRTLRAATTDALTAIGLDAPPCPGGASG